MNINKIRAFTLVDILITFVILGLLIVLTIPALMQDIRREEFKSRLKESISIITNAIRNQVILSGYNMESINDFADLDKSMTKYITIVDIIDGNMPEGCLRGYKVYSGSVFYYMTTPPCTNDSPCKVMIDINNDSDPNKYYKKDSSNILGDRFDIFIYPEKVEYSEDTIKFLIE